MKRHLDDMSQKNKRFSYNNDNRYNDNRSPLHPSPQSAGRPPSRDGIGSGGGGGGSGGGRSSGGGGFGFSYSSSMWVDPRSDSKGHSNMNVFQPQNVMMQWTNPNAAIYNPMQPPPPLPRDRPPDTPPPPPPHDSLQSRRNMSLNRSMNRTSRNPLRPDLQGYMNLGPYKKNINHPSHQQNHQNHHSNHHQNHHSMGQKNGSNLGMAGPSLKPKLSDGKQMDDMPLKPSLKVNKKARRKPMSERYTCKKEWNAEDAHKALTLENAYNHLIKKVPMLILRFPDPELNKALIHSYSPAIETVHFQQPSRARYCFVQLKPDADIEHVKKEISQIEFGTGKISVENKITRHEVAEVTPEQLDPYTLYVGNLPTKLNVTIFKEKFPTAKRIDIGYAQRTKFTRYAFLHYDSVEDSMEAFKSTYNLTIDARSLVVRFRRNKGSVGLSEKGKKTKKDEAEGGADGNGGTGGVDDKKDVKKQPSGAPLFDDEMVDTKANVKEKAEELLKQGYGLDASTAEDNNSIPNVKQEPVSDDDCPSEAEFGFDGDNDPFDEDETFVHSDFDGSDNDYDDDNNEYGNSEAKEYGCQHWERKNQPDIAHVKEEKPDDYTEPEKVPEENKPSETENDNDDLDDLFNGLNPDDDQDIGLDDL